MERRWVHRLRLKVGRCVLVLSDLADGMALSRCLYTQGEMVSSVKAAVRGIVLVSPHLLEGGKEIVLS